MAGVMADKMSIDRQDSLKDDTEDSLGSSPEPEIPVNAAAAAQENQQPKRKGGRKPIYATSEERKQRNRQAQAAFRERRTEYIKQLEEAIRVHEQNLHNLQAAHRNAADECLMLRYKNSLLERILLEKGIDVQAELRAKTGSPTLGPTHMPQNMIQPPPIQRALLNRHGRRSNSSIAPKLEPGVTISPLPTPLQTHSSTASPRSRPTPPSNAASPAGTTSFGPQHGASPASSDHVSAQIRHAMPLAGAMKAQAVASIGPLPSLTQTTASRQMRIPATQRHRVRAAVAGTVTPATFYPTPAFQNHIEQLEQEYDAGADLLDDAADPPDTPTGPGPYPDTGGPHPMALSSPTTVGPHQTSMNGVLLPSPQHGGAYPSMTQLMVDQGEDWDPFGLSASMAFPTQFTFDTSNMR